MNDGVLTRLAGIGYTRRPLKAFARTSPPFHGAFLTTHWTIVDQADPQKNLHSPETVQRAVAQICQDYWLPLYCFVRRSGYDESEAKDLTQGFFEYLLDKRAFARSDRTKGRYRTFLLCLLKRYLGAVRARQQRQKRGGAEASVGLDSVALDEVTTDDALLIDPRRDEDHPFDAGWARQLVDRAMTALEKEYATEPRKRLLGELRPFLTGGIGLPTQAEAAARLEVPIETVRSQLFRLRGRYRALLRAEVARTVRDVEDVEDELRYLCRVLIAAV